MIFAFLLFCQQPQTVTFEHACAKAEVVLADLGKELGMDLRPSGTVQDDYFVVRFAGVPVQEALDKIAKTLNASWTKQGAVTYLGRTRPQDVADFEAEYAEKVRLIKEAVKSGPEKPFDAKAAEELALKVREFGTVKSYEDSVRFQPLAAQLPGYRAMVALVSHLDFDDLVRTSATPVTFGSSGDRPFPSGSEAVLERLSREWSDYSAASARAGLPSTDVYQKLSGTVTDLKSSMQLDVHVSESNIMFVLNVLDTNQWQTIGRLSITYNTGGEVPKWATGLNGKLELDAPSLLSVKPSQITEGHPELLAALIGDGTADTALSVPGSAMLQAAKARGVSMVASLGDSCYLALATSALSPEPTNSQTLGALFAARSLRSEEADGWITVVPTNPYRERWKRMDREAFQRMCRYAAVQKSLPLDQFADFVATTKDDDALSVGKGLFERAFSLSHQLPDLGVACIRLYGLLPAQERRRVRAEDVEFMGRPDLSKYAIALAQVASTYYEFDQAAPPSRRQPFHEQQDALATIPQGFDWSLRVVSDQFVQPHVKEPKAGDSSFFWDAESFAMNSVMQERFPSTPFGYDCSSVALVHGDTLTIRYEKGAGTRTARMGGFLSHYADPMTSFKYGSINDLPTELRDAILKKQEEFRKQFGGG